MLGRPSPSSWSAAWTPRTSPAPSSYPDRPSPSVVRAKRTLSAANIRFELPGAGERPARLAAVREVIYLVFNDGYSAISGASWMRTDLCAEALRLGRMLASLPPYDTESLGLLALMELQASRLKARTGPGGEPVLLMDQDRTRWDHLCCTTSSMPKASSTTSTAAAM